MSKDTTIGQYPENAPRENFARGITHVDIPQLGAPTLRGKVRDNWVIDGAYPGDERLRVLVTTDRVSAYDKLVAAIPNKGAVLNRTTQFWMERTADIMPNHMISVPHPNVMIARQAEATLPVEVVVRRYFAESSTSTNIFRMYNEGYQGHAAGPEAVRAAYGIDLPEGLVANQRLPELVVTPTTKSDEHDLPLTPEQTEDLVDSQFGAGMWGYIQDAALEITQRAEGMLLRKGLILADTKIEFGMDSSGAPMVIDELMTSDSSRFWLLDTYEERMANGQKPQNFDKEILRRYLAEQGFKGEGPIPVVPDTIFKQMAHAYELPFIILTRDDSFNPGNPDPVVIAEAAMDGVNEALKASFLNS